MTQSMKFLKCWLISFGILIAAILFLAGFVWSLDHLFPIIGLTGIFILFAGLISALIALAIMNAKPKP